MAAHTLTQCSPAQHRAHDRAKRAPRSRFVALLRLQDAAELPPGAAPALLSFPRTYARRRSLRTGRLRDAATSGKLQPEPFLRFTSPVRTSYPENDEVNARWYPAASFTRKAAPGAHRSSPVECRCILPQRRCALSSIALGSAAYVMSKPYHDIRRPAELERSDYAVSSNLGRTIAACRQAVVDIRSCLDWLQQQGFEQFGSPRNEPGILLRLHRRRS